MTIEAMDGRKRGQILRGTDGKFTTRKQWINNVQDEINQFYQKNKVYKKYLDQNPDLKVLIEKNEAEIASRQKEINLVNNSRRGINDRVRIYREAMEKQGLTGQQLEEQVARYKDGLMAKRKERFNELKGQNEARLKANEPTKVDNNPPEPKKQSKNIFKRFGAWVGKTWKSGAKGKIGLILGAVTVIGGLIAGAVALSGKDKSAQPAQPGKVQKETAQKPVTKETETQPAKKAEVPETPQFKPQAPVDAAGNYTVVNGDGEYIIAEKLLNDYKQTHPDFEVSQPNIAILADALIKERKAALGKADDPTKRIALPMMHPNEQIKVPNLDELFKTRLNIQS